MFRKLRLQQQQQLSSLAEQVGGLGTKVGEMMDMKQQQQQLGTKFDEMMIMMRTGYNDAAAPCTPPGVMTTVEASTPVKVQAGPLRADARPFIPADIPSSSWQASGVDVEAKGLEVLMDPPMVPGTFFTAGALRPAMSVAEETPGGEFAPEAVLSEECFDAGIAYFNEDRPCAEAGGETEALALMISLVWVPEPAESRRHVA